MIRRSFIILSFFALVVLVACGGEDLPEKEPSIAVHVKTAVAEVQPVDYQTSYSGTAEPVERARLSTKIMGWVEEIRFEEGDAFKKGDVLVRLRSQDLEAKRAQAEAAISAATVHFQNMETNLKRIENLFAKKAATQKELDDMRSAYAAAKAQKIQAEKMKVEVDEILKYSNIRAPFSGIVGRKMVQEGDMANPGMPLLEIENPQKMKIVAKVPENEVARLRVGMPVWVHVGASDLGTDGKNIRGKLDKIVPAADPMSRQFDIHVLVDNSDGRIKSGMFARVAVGHEATSALLVPGQAIFKRGQLEGVYVVDAKMKAHLRWIRSGSAYADQIEVLSGLNPGERVVIEGMSQLTDGQSVEVTQ